MAALEKDDLLDFSYAYLREEVDDKIIEALKASLPKRHVRTSLACLSFMLAKLCHDHGPDRRDARTNLEVYTGFAHESMHKMFAESRADAQAASTAAVRASSTVSRVSRKAANTDGVTVLATSEFDNALYIKRAEVKAVLGISDFRLYKLDAAYGLRRYSVTLEIGKRMYYERVQIYAMNEWPENKIPADWKNKVQRPPIAAE